MVYESGQYPSDYEYTMGESQKFHENGICGH